MKIALIGFGTVGRGAYDIIKDRNKILEKILEPIEVAYVVATERSRERLAKELKEPVVTAADYEKVLDEVNLVVEATGAIESAYDYMKRALARGIGVVTANKAAVSAYYEELDALAKKTNAPFLFEAAVGGGIPVLTPLRSLCLQNEISNIRGILNGTCNYLINAMFKDNADYEETLALCQELGYAEQDPTDDVEGYDTRRKLHILIEMAYGHVDGEAIPTRGIAQLSKDIVAYMNARGVKVKLLASAKPVEGGIEAVVEPVVLDRDDALAILPDAINRVDVTGSWVGELAFTGPGAGREATGNAVVSDIVSAMSGSYHPLLEREETKLAPVSGRYLIAGEHSGDIVARVEEGFTVTKEIARDELSKFIDEETFFARIETSKI